MLPMAAQCDNDKAMPHAMLRFLNGRFGALVEGVTAADLQSPELGRVLRRTWLQAGLSLPQHLCTTFFQAGFHQVIQVS